ERLFNLLGDGKIESHQNWKGRFKDNSDRMRTGSIYDVVEVLKSLSHLSKSKSLSFREKRMLDRAKFLVVSEITEVLGEKTPEVEVKVEQALERCFATKAKNAAKAKAAATATATAAAAAAARPKAAAKAAPLPSHPAAPSGAAWLFAAIRTTAAAVVVSGWVLLAGPPLLLWTLPTSRRRALYAAGAFGVHAGFWLAGIRVRTEGAEHMPSGG